MDGAELLGRTIQVSLAQANQLHKLTGSNNSSEAIWKSDEWFQQYAGGNNEANEQKDMDVDTLTKSI
jgi:hypothetical protein